MQVSNGWTQVFEIEIMKTLLGNTIHLWFKQLEHGVYLWKILLQKRQRQTNFSKTIFVHEDQSWFYVGIEAKMRHSILDILLFVYVEVYY